MKNLAPRAWRVVAALTMVSAASGCGLALEPRFYRLEPTRDANVAQDVAASDGATDGAIEFPDAIVSIDAVEDTGIGPILPDATLGDVVVTPPPDGPFEMLDAPVSMTDARFDTGADVRRDTGNVDTGVDSGLPVDAGSRPDAAPDAPTDALRDTGGVGCGSGLTRCGAVCVDLDNDRGNCGACGNSCPATGYCSGGRCASCPFPGVICPVVGGGSCCGLGCIPGGGCSGTMIRDAE